MDPGRSRVRLLPDDVEVLSGIRAGDPDCLDHPRTLALEECGLLRDGRPVPAVAELLTVLEGARRVLEVETVHAVPGEDPPQRLLTHRLVLGAGSAVVVEAEVGEEEVTLVGVDAPAAAAELARLVGLRDRPRPGGRPLTAPAAVLDGLAGVLAGLRDPTSAAADVRTVLTVAGLGDDAAARLAEVLCSRRGAWRVDGTLHVTDAGPAGLWERTSAAAGQVTLVPRSADEVRAALAALTALTAGPGAPVRGGSPEGPAS